MSAWEYHPSVGPADLEPFIREREWRCCFYGARLPASRGAGPRKGDGHAVLRDRGRVSAAALLGGEGTVLPVSDGLGDESLRALAVLMEEVGFSPGRVVGMTGDVEAVASLFGDPDEVIDYRLMRGIGVAESALAPEGLLLRLAGASDFEELLPLQEAYEREEVLVPGHAFDARAVAAGLRDSLARQSVMVAESNVGIVAKAQTNARGFAWDQLGGIFVRPEWRGRGIGTAVTAALRRAIEAEGRSSCLFVRNTNPAAARAYEKAGFVDSSPYRIAYFS